MTTAFEKLMYTVSLIDRASGPASKITAQMDKLYSRSTAGSLKIIGGAAGMASVGYSLKSLLGPAIEMDRAIGEVKSLGVHDSALKLLEKTALKTSIQYGDSATDIVRASYDIQSAIAGLNGIELSRFTAASAILAKGTKSDTATITDYLGTMYGIFQNTANAMGKAEWVEMLAGQTANAVQMFKTTGIEMAASFASLGAEANSHGLALSEQMAILGTLQATMSGSESGTKYKSFLAGVGKAQKELGLQFTDSNGRMLPMLDILDKIQGKFGNIDTVAKSDLLQKAFGRKEAVGLIKLLMQNTDGLKNSIDSLDKVSGMEKAMDMAKAMADPWERLDAVGVSVRTSFGRILQPVLNPLIDRLIAGGETVNRWIDLFPNLTRVVGIAMLVVMGLIATVSVFAIIGGIAQLTVAGWGAAMLIATGITKGYALVTRVLSGTIAVFRAVVLAGAIQLGAMNMSMGLSTAAAWLFNAALWANPITWIVAGVIALVGVLAVLIYHWDAVSSAVSGFMTRALTSIGEGWRKIENIVSNNQFLKLAFAPLYAIGYIVDFVVATFAKIPEWLTGFSTWLSELNLFESISNAARFAFMPLLVVENIVNLALQSLAKLPEFFNGLKNFVTGLNPFESLGEGVDWILEKMNHIPGISIDASANITGNTRREMDAMRVDAPFLSAGLTDKSLPGGLRQEISNNNTNKGVHVEKMEVNTTGGVDGFRLVDELMLAGG